MKRLDMFTRIGGMNNFRAPICALLQTDGSFHHRTGLSRVAMRLQNPAHTEIYQKMTVIPNAQDSTETEWASISHGLLFALESGERNLEVENDNLGVVSALILKEKVMKQEYAKYYRYIILNTASKTEWTGIRWIPRELNLADALFHGKSLKAKSPRLR